MSEDKITIKVRFFDGFECQVGDRHLSFEGSASSRMTQMLIFLMYWYPTAQPKAHLLENLYADSESDAANSFKTMLFRLRKALGEEIGCTDMDCIILKNGMMRLADYIVIDSDAGRFAQLTAAAEKLEDGAEKAELLEQAAHTYRGELLPMLATENWVIYENATLQNRYLWTVNELYRFYTAAGNYNMAYRVCKQGMVYNPYNEDLLIGAVESLVSMGDVTGALREFEEISMALYDELGMNPSERLLDTVRNISDRVSESLPKPENVGMELSEAAPLGAYYCSYPNFVSTYKMLKRIEQRSNIQNSLALASLVNERGEVMNDKSDIASAMAGVRIAISKTLRRSDMFSRYSRNQLLIMFWRTNSEGAALAVARINDALERDGAGCRLNYAIVGDETAIN